MKKRRLRLFLLFMSFALIFSGSPMVLAQENAGEDSTDSDEFMLEEVVVTGSRIAREEGFGQISPVTVMGEEDIGSFGLTRIEDVLNTLPQLETGQNATWNNGASGTASLDLRGLGPERTLVLMNGRRIQPGGTWTQIVDVNQVPTAMVERVEVLTGGASAIYGADAVAGVVNFIMRKVKGLELSLGESAYQHENNNGYMQGLMDEAGFSYPTGNTGFDGRTYDINLIAGSDFAGGRGNATVYASWRKNDELLQGQRDYTACALDLTGTYCGGSGNAPVPNFYIAPLIGDTQDGEFDWGNYWEATLQPDSSLDDWVGNLYNYGPVNYLQRPDERWSAGAFLDYEVNENTTAYMEIQYFNDHSKSQSAPSGTFFAEEYHLPIDNTLFPAAFQASLAEMYPGQTWFGFYIGKRNVEGGPRTETLNHSSFRIVGGIKGAINDNWDYDVYYLQGRTISSAAYANDFFADKLSVAVDGEACAADSDCTPYNVFTYGGITSEDVAALGATAISNNETSIQVVSGVVSGDTGFGLSAGDIYLVGGYEFREETYEDIRDTVFELGLQLGGYGPVPSLAGEFHVNELFGEASIPLLADRPFVKDLTMNLALRLSDHDVTGSSATYRAGLDWHATDMLRLRTGYNRAVRSPNIEELFYNQSVQLWTGTDPCAGSNPVYTQEQCERTGVTASQYGSVPESPASQYNMLYGGNPDLDPEEADTITFGVVVEPLEDLTLSLDYWNIDMDQTIDTIGAETIIDLCATTGQLCELIHRAGGGNLWIGRDGYVVNTIQNIGQQEWEGLDFAAAYWLDALDGTWNINMIGTYMLTKETTSIAGDPSTTYDCVDLINTECYPTPRWRHTASVTYDSHEFWSITARWRFFKGVDYDGGVDEVVNLTNTSYLDLNAVFKFWENHDVIVGVNNAFDKDPPLVGDGFGLPPFGNGNVLAGYYDTMGRYFYTKATFRF